MTMTRRASKVGFLNRALTADNGVLVLVMATAAATRGRGDFERGRGGIILCTKSHRSRDPTSTATTTKEKAATRPSLTTHFDSSTVIRADTSSLSLSRTLSSV